MKKKLIKLKPSLVAFHQDNETNQNIFSISSFCALFFHPCIYTIDQKSTTLLLLMQFFLYHQSVTCSFGSVNSGVSATNYTCPTPDVIQRVDKYAAAISQFGKQPSDDVQITVILYSLTASTNITSFVIAFTNVGIQNIYVSYFIVAIGNQPQNDWVDLFQVIVPQDLTNTLQGGNSSIRSMQWLFQASNVSRFNDLTGVIIISFISSIKTLSMSTSINQIQFNSAIINSTHFQGGLTASNYTACNLFVGFFLFYKPLQIANQAGSYQHTGFNLFPNGDHYVDFSLIVPAWGPRFNTKCLLGYWETNYLRDQDYDFRFSATMKGNVVRLVNWGINTTNTIFRGNAFCLAFGVECGETQNFYDKITNSCYNASSCPIPTPNLTSIPPASELCILCYETDCLNCLSSDRNYCTECNATSNTQLSAGDCVCIPGMYRPVTDCVINCTYYLNGCLIMNCTSQTFCTECEVGYYLDQVSNITQNCVKCSDTISNCVECSISISCTLLCSPICTKCNSLFGMTSANQCVSCSILFNHCLSCSNDTVCEQCEINNLTYTHNGTCLKCTDLDTQCNGCSYDGIGITCTSCNVGYYLDPVLKTCIQCSSTIYDCQQCQMNLLNFKVQCTLCSSSFLVDDNFTCQKCKQFKYVSRTCTNTTGCQSSQLINGVLICIACDSTFHFAYNTTTKQCQCKQGFSFDQLNSQCNQICGDGIRESMQCDDGNTISFDGCSSSCKVEQNYVCQNNQQGTSKCVLNQDFSVVYDCMLRHLDENKVSLYFNVTPPSTALSKVNWANIITFNFSESISMQTTYENGILVVTLEYKSDIEGKILNLGINFDSSIIKSQPQNLTIKMNAINGPLTYSESFDSFKTFKYTGLVIGILCLLFYLISSYFHKMIGLQTIQFIQLLYFSRLICQNAKQSSFYGLNSLKYSNGYNDLTQDHTSLETYKSLDPSFVRLDLSLYFLDNCNLMLIPVGLASIGYVVFSLKKSYHRSKFLEKNERIHQDKYTITSRKVNLFYENLIFAFTLALMYLVFFSTIIFLKSNKKSIENDFFNILSLGMNLIVLFYISGIYCYEFIQGIRKQIEMNNSSTAQSKQKSMEHDANTIGNGFHHLYVPAYLLYQLLLIIIMNLIFTDYSLITQTLLAVCILYLLLIIFWKPYELNFHNNAIIANQITVVFFITVLTLVKYNVLSTALFTVVISITLVMVAITTLLQIVRLYLHRKLQRKSSQSGNPSKQDLSNEQKLRGLLKEENPFLLQNQIRTFQQAERKYIQKNLFGKYYVENHSENYKKFFLNKKNLTVKLNDFDQQKKFKIGFKTPKMQIKLEEDNFQQNDSQDFYLQQLGQTKDRLKNELRHGFI